MGSLRFILSPTISPSAYSLCCSKVHFHSNGSLPLRTPTHHLQAIIRPTFASKIQLRFLSVRRSHSYSNPPVDEEEQGSRESVQDLRIPDHWLNPSKALEESQWLRETLHRWLDDEYCPEETNVEISKVAANSYYNSLAERQTDLGEILLRMARALESISYQESFHGAFSAANAAVNLVIQRIEQD